MISRKRSVVAKNVTVQKHNSLLAVRGINHKYIVVGQDI